MTREQLEEESEGGEVEEDLGDAKDIQTENEIAQRKTRTIKRKIPAGAKEGEDKKDD